jgi:carbon storage regulator
MLVLTRKKNERIVIGDKEIIITIAEIRGDKVKVGIEAAASVAVDREEVYEAKKRGAKA